MIRCVILDDEPIILRSMKTKIQNLHPDFVVVATATDGRKGLQLILDLKPDCVFTDINMPLIDGLELIEKVKHCCENPPIFVILSGYSEFEYARKALKLGTMDYLIKPISNMNLSKLLLEIKEKLDMQEKTNAAAVIKNLLNREGKETDLNIISERIAKAEGIFIGMKICIGPFFSQRFRHIRMERHLRDDFDFELICKALCEDGDEYYIHYDNFSNERTIVFFTRQKYEVFVNAAYAEMKAHLGEHLKITCISTPPLENAEQMVHMLPLLDRALCESAVFAESRHVLIGSNWEWRVNKSAVIDDALTKAVLQMQEIAGISRLAVAQEVFRICEEHRCIQLQLVDVIRKLLAATGVDNGSNRALLSEILVCSSDNYDDLETGFAEMLQSENQVQNLREDEDESNTEAIINKVAEYIDSNYKDRILVQGIAKKFGFNPSYLCTIYRKYKGISPNEYITEKRITKAKAMLKYNTELTVKQIAGEVGYEDAYYFSRVFRNVTGISPTEYRKQFNLDPTII